MSSRRGMARLPAGRSTGLCRPIILKEAHTEIQRRLGDTVGPLTREPQAALNSPRVRTARPARTRRGTRRRREPLAHLTQDRHSRHIRVMSEVVPLSHRRNRRVRLAPALCKARPAPCRPLRIRSTRRTCHTEHNHRSIRVTRLLRGHLSRPRLTHMIQTLI